MLSVPRVGVSNRDFGGVRDRDETEVCDRDGVVDWKTERRLGLTDAPLAPKFALNDGLDDSLLPPDAIVACCA